MTAIRVAYVTPEVEAGMQRGKRRAFAQLLATDHIEAVKIVSPRVRRNRGGNTAGMVKEIVDFLPSIVFFEHPGSGMLHPEEITALRKALSDAAFVVFEMDIYDVFRKRYPAELRNAVAVSDVVITPGASTQFRDYRRMGADRVVWIPSGFNPADFGSLPLNRAPVMDVVMIASDASSRLPLWSIPGSRGRARLADGLRHHFGEKFALYGQGWPTAWSRGPIPFTEQERALQTARVSANFDHYPNEARFFSNRLPITMASGSVHVTSMHPEYEDIFPPETREFLHLHQTPDQIITVANELVHSLDDDTRLSLGERARRFAFEHFREDDLLVRALNEGGANIDPTFARKAWSVNVPAIAAY